MKKIYQHGDSTPKANNPSGISGHMYNPVSGTIDSYVDGKFSHHLCQLHDPKPELARKTFAVGTVSKLKLDYNSGPSEWKPQSAVIWPKGK